MKRLTRWALYGWVLCCTGPTASAQGRGGAWCCKSFLVHHRWHVLAAKGVSSVHVASYVRRRSNGYRSLILSGSRSEYLDTLGRDTLVIRRDAAGHQLERQRKVYAVKACNRCDFEDLRSLARGEFYNAADSLVKFIEQTPTSGLKVGPTDSGQTTLSAIIVQRFNERGLLAETQIRGAQRSLGIRLARRRLYVRYLYNYTYRAE